MKALGKDRESLAYWQDEAQQYAEAMSNQYHAHRLAVIDALIPDELYQPGKRIFDFGCGDAVHFAQFLKAGAHIEGNDIAPAMIEVAQQCLAQQGFDSNLARVGTVADLAQLPDASLDAMISFNVLAYLDDQEEKTFYRETARLVKPGGYLVVTHSNELFDMFSLNRYTVAFYQRHFGAHVAGLLTQAEKPEEPTAYNVRENPLAYRYKLQSYGFEEIRQEFSNLHSVPPLQITGTKHYPDTLHQPESERWRLMFQCSTYGSCSRRL